MQLPTYNPRSQPRAKTSDIPLALAEKQVAARQAKQGAIDSALKQAGDFTARIADDNATTEALQAQAEMKNMLTKFEQDLNQRYASDDSLTMEDYEAEYRQGRQDIVDNTTGSLSGLAARKVESAAITEITASQQRADLFAVNVTAERTYRNAENSVQVGANLIYDNPMAFEDQLAMSTEAFNSLNINAAAKEKLIEGAENAFSTARFDKMYRDGNYEEMLSDLSPDSSAYHSYLTQPQIDKYIGDAEKAIGNRSVGSYNALNLDVGETVSMLSDGNGDISSIDGLREQIEVISQDPNLNDNQREGLNVMRTQLDVAEELYPLMKQLKTASTIPDENGVSEYDRITNAMEAALQKSENYTLRSQFASSFNSAQTERQTAVEDTPASYAHKNFPDIEQSFQGVQSAVARMNPANPDSVAEVNGAWEAYKGELAAVYDQLGVPESNRNLFPEGGEFMSTVVEGIYSQAPADRTKYLASQTYFMSDEDLTRLSGEINDQADGDFKQTNLSAALAFIKDDPQLANKLLSGDDIQGTYSTTDMRTALNTVIPPAIMGGNSESFYNAAMALYNSEATGEELAEFSEDRFDSVVKQLVGEPVVFGDQRMSTLSFKDPKTNTYVAPDAFQNGLKRMTDEDLIAGGQSLMYINGRPQDTNAILRVSELIPTGDGRYMVQLPRSAMSMNPNAPAAAGMIQDEAGEPYVLEYKDLYANGHVNTQRVMAPRGGRRVNDTRSRLEQERAENIELMRASGYEWGAGAPEPIAEPETRQTPRGQRPVR